MPCFMNSCGYTRISLLCRIALITQEASCFNISVVVWLHDPLRIQQAKFGPHDCAIQSMAPSESRHLWDTKIMNSQEHRTMGPSSLSLGFLTWVYNTGFIDLSSETQHPSQTFKTMMLIWDSPLYVVNAIG